MFSFACVCRVQFVLARSAGFTKVEALFDTKMVSLALNSILRNFLLFSDAVFYGWP